MSPGDAHRLQDAAWGAWTYQAGTGGFNLILLAERDPYAAEFAEFFLKTKRWKSPLHLTSTTLNVHWNSARRESR